MAQDPPITVRLFAEARDRAGTAVVELPSEGLTCIADVRRRLVQAVPALAELLPRVSFAIDCEYASEAAPIRPGSEVAVIPPVSGG